MPEASTPANTASCAVHKAAKLASVKAGDGHWEPATLAEVPREGLRMA